MLEVTKKVQNLMIDAPETAQGLMSQINQLSAAKYSKEEAEDLIFQEDDFLESVGEIEEETPMWLAVRDIQHDMVRTFTED